MKVWARECKIWHIDDANKECIMLSYEGVDGDGKQLASEASVGAYKTTIKASLMAPLEKDALDIELGMSRFL